MLVRGLRLTLPELAEGGADDLTKQILLVPEVQIERARRDAGPPGDLGAGGTVEPLPGEELRARLHQATARLPAAAGSSRLTRVADFGFSR
jgi:hypothetical protein